MSEPVQVLIADDHDVVRDSLRLILESEDDFEVACEAASGAEAMRRCAELNPQVVLMDLRAAAITVPQQRSLLPRDL